MIIATYTAKAFDRIQYPFITRTPSILRIHGNVFNLIKSINEKFIGDIIFNGKKLNAIFLKLGTIQ